MSTVLDQALDDLYAASANWQAPSTLGQIVAGDTGASGTVSGGGAATGTVTNGGLYFDGVLQAPIIVAPMEPSFSFTPQPWAFSDEAVDALIQKLRERLGAGGLEKLLALEPEARPDDPDGPFAKRPRRVIERIEED